MTYVKRKATSKRAQRTANDEEYKNYSPTRLFTGSTIPAADTHAKCGKVTPRGARQAGIVKVNRATSSMAADKIYNLDCINSKWSHVASPKVKPCGLR